jgi:putative nucleotidyltransferase with HDIG domain
MVTTNRAAYRIRQFWHAINAGYLSQSALEEVSAILNSAQLELFYSQSSIVQQHSYRVMRLLRVSGNDDNDLLEAALLHDVGKTKMPVKWWERPFVVLVQSLIPTLSATWASGPPESWRRPFVVQAKHAEWGAEMAEAAMSSATTVTLIRRHQDPAEWAVGMEREDRLLRMLQWADGSN